MGRQTTQAFLTKRSYPSGSLWVLRVVLVLFVLWLGAALLLGITDVMELNITLGIGAIMLALVYIFMHRYKRAIAPLSLTRREFIAADEAPHSINPANLSSEQIENFRSELRSLCDSNDISIMEKAHLDRKNDTPVNAQTDCRKAA